MISRPSKLQVTVENEQQSLAIGKRGQNVRLAAKLVGWDIDIRSEEEMKREIASQMEQIITAPVVKISSIEGITPADSETLAEHGIETIEQLAEATVDDLSDWLDLSVDEAQELLDMALAITEARRAHAREHAAGTGEGDEISETGVEPQALDEIEVVADAQEAEAHEAEAQEVSEVESGADFDVEAEEEAAVEDKAESNDIVNDVVNDAINEEEENNAATDKEGV